MNRRMIPPHNKGDNNVDMGHKSNFSLAEKFAAVLGLTAPAAIMMTGIAGYFNSVSFGLVALASSAPAAYSFGKFGKEFLIGVTNEIAPTRFANIDKFRDLQAIAKERSGGVQLHATLMEAGLHAGMYFTALATTQNSPVIGAAAFGSFAAFAFHAKTAIDNMRSITKPFRNAVDDKDNNVYLAGRNIGRAAGLCSVSAITLAILGVHAESWPLLMASAVPSVIGSGFVSQVGRFSAKNATQYAPAEQRERLEKKINTRASAISAGLAELSVHSTMFCSGAAILSDNSLLWGTAAASLLSCGYFAKQTIRTQGDAIKAVLQNEHPTVTDDNHKELPLITTPKINTARIIEI